MLETLKNIGNKVLIKEHDILKKPYLAPRISFEEIEEDEREMLMAGSDNTGGGGDLQPGGGDEVPEENSLDIDFSMDFVINDEPKI